VKIEAFLHWHKYEWEAKPEFRLTMSDMSDSGPEWVCLGPREVEVDVPDGFDPRPLQVAALRAEREKIVAECEVKKTNIDEQIMRLLAIESKPDRVEA
jgi:hypothetical protein